MQVWKKAVGATVAATAMAALGASAARAQTIFSDDFSSSLATGATTSDYTLISLGSSTGPNQYRVVNNPNTSFANASSFTSYFDHTQGTAQGAMLFFDGASSNSTRIYFRSGVNLTVNTQYTFSFWGSSANNTSTPLLNVLIDSFSVGTANMVTTNGTWTQYTTTYTPTFSGPHTFAIIDNNTAAVGNDGAIDDVRLVGPAAAGPEPGTLSLIGIGLVTGAGRWAGVRRRRKAAKSRV